MLGFGSSKRERSFVIPFGPQATIASTAVCSSKKVALGKIISIVGNSIGVDQWDGGTPTISAVPSGGDDFVYRLNGDAAQLGILNSSSGAVAMTYTSVASNVAQGYVVSVYSDGDLRANGSIAIDNVADSVVTVGSEEYGASVMGAHATGTGMDFPLTPATRVIQENSSIAQNDRSILLYKASISPATPPGSYAQQVIYTLTAQF
jgi:hypothetical protein